MGSLPLHSVRVLCGIVLFFITNSAVGQYYNTEIEAKIQMEEKFNFLSITATAYNISEISQSLRYELSVIKGDKDSGNKSRNTQKGRFVLSSSEQKSLSTTSINKSETDRIIVLLLVYDSQDKLVGKDRIVINGTEEDKQERIVLQKKNEENNSPDVANTQADGVVLRGIVVEDTKTKSGRDFYRMVSYELGRINAKQIITVKEDLAIGNNTKIEVFADQTLVMEFVIRPQNEYLKAMGDETIRRIKRYVMQEKNKTQVRRY